MKTSQVINFIASNSSNLNQTKLVILFNKVNIPFSYNMLRVFNIQTQVKQAIKMILSTEAALNWEIKVFRWMINDAWY